MGVPDEVQAAAAKARAKSSASLAGEHAANHASAEKASTPHMVGDPSPRLEGRNSGKQVFHNIFGSLESGEPSENAPKDTKYSKKHTEDWDKWANIPLCRTRPNFRSVFSHPSEYGRSFIDSKSIFLRIAENKMFENVTLCIITANALWIGVDLELNNSSSWLEAPPIFQIADNAFCLYFTFEVVVRFMAFEKWVNCISHKEFIFDTVLVILMIMETWVLTIITALSSQESTGTDMSQASIFRLLRLLRLTRVARLMKAFPELLVLIKGLIAALRSVAINFLFLLAGLWVFGIIFLQQYQDAPGTDPEISAVGLRDDYFPNLGTAMVTLLVNGTLLDELNSLALLLKDDSWFMLSVFFFFILLSSLTLLNMLIGVLAEVVASTAEEEGSENAVMEAIKIMKDTFNIADFNYDGEVSSSEFERLIEDKNSAAVKAITGIGIDIEALEILFQQIFEDEDALNGSGPANADRPSVISSSGVLYESSQVQNKESDISRNVSKTGFATKCSLGFVEFMDALLQLKPGCPVSVRDVCSLRRLSDSNSQGALKALVDMEDRLKQLTKAVRDLQYSTRAALESRSSPAVVDDSTVGVPAADPSEGQHCQQGGDACAGSSGIAAQAWPSEGNANGTQSRVPLRPSGGTAESAPRECLQPSPHHVVESGSFAAEETVPLMGPSSSVRSHASASRQATQPPVSSLLANSVRWPPAPVEPFAPLPKLGSPGADSSPRVAEMSFSTTGDMSPLCWRPESPKKVTGHTCGNKLSTVPTEMIIEEMARRMLRGIDHNKG